MKIVPISPVFGLRDYRLSQFRKDEKIFSDLLKSHLKKAHHTPDMFSA